MGASIFLENKHCYFEVLHTDCVLRLSNILGMAYLNKVVAFCKQSEDIGITDSKCGKIPMVSEPP